MKNCKKMNGENLWYYFGVHLPCTSFLIFEAELELYAADIASNRPHYDPIHCIVVCMKQSLFDEGVNISSKTELNRQLLWIDSKNRTRFSEMCR